MFSAVGGLQSLSPSRASRGRRRAAFGSMVVGAILIGLTSTAASPIVSNNVPAERSASPLPAMPKAVAESLPRLSGDIEMTVELRRADGLAELLRRAGISDADSIAAAEAMPAGIGQDKRTLQLFLSAGGDAKLRLAGIEWQPQLGVTHQLARGADGRFTLSSSATDIDATPRRFTGQAGPALFWSLRAAGVPADSAQAYLDAISSRFDLAEAKPADRFDLVVERRQTSTGESEWGSVLYAGLDRLSGADIRLVRWSIHGQDQWAEPGSATQRVDGMNLPVAGRLSSGFGYRFHPILGVGKFHRGIDLAARRGTPVVAAADGLVTAAGWNGGYGKQVTLAHADGLATSYGHLSGIATAAGHRIRRGEVIGYVGSTGM